MFKSILFTVFSLFCVYASFNDAKPISSLRSNNNIHAETIANALTEMGTTIDSMKQIHSAFISLADDPTAVSTCSSLASDAATKISTDCSAVFSAGPLDISSFLSNGQVASACDGPLKSEAIIKCSTTFSTSYTAAINACGATNASDVSVAIITKLQGNVQIFANLTALVTLGKAICTKSDDGNSYCIDKLFANGIKDAFADPTKINNTLSKQFCSSCAKQLANTLSGIDQFKRLTDGLTFLCTIDPTNSTNYCMDSVKVLVSISGTISSGKDFDAAVSALTDVDLKQLCSPCTISVLNSFDLIKDNLKQFNIDTTQFKQYIPKLKGACLRDPQNGNDSCPARLKVSLGPWAEAQFNNQQVQAGLLSKCRSLLEGQCSADCAGAITQLLAGFGCCLGTLTKEQLAAYVPANQAATFGLALSACAFDLPKACDAPKNINLPVTFVLDNLRFEWATAASTNAKFIAAFTADLATAFSLDASSIIIKTISPTIKGGVRVVVEFSVDSNVVEGYKATIKARINAAAGLSFGQTSTASNTPSDTNNPSSTGKINQAQGLQADPSTSDVGTASGAMTIKASIATIILSIVSFIAIKLF